MGNHPQLNSQLLSMLVRLLEMASGEIGDGIGDANKMVDARKCGGCRRCISPIKHLPRSPVFSGEYTVFIHVLIQLVL